MAVEKSAAKSRAASMKRCRETVSYESVFKGTNILATVLPCTWNNFPACKATEKNSDFFFKEVFSGPVY